MADSLISNGDVVIAANEPIRPGGSIDDSSGDIVLRTGGVERHRLKSDGTGTGVFGGSLTALDDVTVSSDTDVSGVGDIVFKTGLVERFRVKATGLITGLLASILGWYNVQAYGAVGDGVTSDSNAIIAALAAASAAGGGVVYLPQTASGYAWTGASPLTVPANVTLAGAGAGSILLLTGGGSGAFVLLSNANAKARNFMVRRGSATPTRLISVTAADCAVRSVIFDGNGFAGTALSFSGGHRVLVKGNTFNLCNGLGVFGTSTNYPRIIANTFIGHLGNSAISFNTNVVGYTINDNTILCDATNPSSAIGCLTNGAGTDCKGGTIDGNTIESGSTAIVIQVTAGGNRPAKTSITGNSLKLLADGASASIISLGSADDITITGNICDANGFTRPQGIEVTTSRYCTVTGNTVIGTGTVTWGIFLNGSSGCTVTGNHVRDIKDTSGANGVRVFSNSATLATDNTVTGNVILMTAGGTAAKAGISLQSANAAAHVDRNTVTGNTIYGDNAAGSKGVELNNNGSGAVDLNYVGGNTIQNVVTALSRSGDTNTLVGANQKAAIARTTISPGASPYTYQNTDGYTETVVVTGGTVSAVSISRDNSTFDQIAAATGVQVVLESGDYLKVTYSVAPTLAKYPAR